MESFLLQLFIFLISAAIAVPIAKKLGLGSVLGYLIAGIVIGPFGVSLIHDIEEVMHFTEFGVVMMLFLVGLELKPSLLWQMRTPILGMGGAQVLLSTLIISAAALLFLPWQQALAIGLILALSSTAIVLQTLREKGMMESTAGRSIFSVLLFQDLAVIPILALLPLLATVTIQADGHHESVLFDISALPSYMQIGATILAILFVFILGKFICKPIFRMIASTQVREIFIATALGLVVGISLLMMTVGLSPALGAFLAGVVLADSEYRHELESDIEPFKGLLLGIFFISIGASLNFTLISDEIAMIVAIVVGLIVFKFFVLFMIGSVFKMEKSTHLFFSIALAQGGEFAFVLFQFAFTHGVLPASTTEPLVAAVAISMFLAPLIFLAHEKLTQGDDTQQQAQTKADTIERGGHKVIVAGFGRLGTDLGRFLISSGIRPVIIDHDAMNVDVLRKLGFEVYFGDITRQDLLNAAGANEAEVLIVTIGDLGKTRHLIELVKKYYPHLKIVANAHDRFSAFELMDLGIETIRRETFGSALDLGEEVMKLLGIDAYDVHRQKRLFKKKDEELMPELHQSRTKEADYISMYQSHNVDLEALMSLDVDTDIEALDKAWTAKNPEH